MWACVTQALEQIRCDKQGGSGDYSLEIVRRTVVLYSILVTDFARTIDESSVISCSLHCLCPVQEALKI